MVCPAACIWLAPLRTWAPESWISARISPAAAALRQGAHLASHHGKAPALLAGTRGLHSGVQRQDVGLEGNALDGGDDLPHPLRRLLDGLHHGPRPRHGGAALLRQLGAALALSQHLQCSVGGVLGGAGQLLHGGGGLLQAGRLRLGARRQVLRALRNLRVDAG